MNKTIIEIRDIIGSEYAVLEEDGQRVHDAILEVLGNGDHAALSFAGIAFPTTPFVRAVIGDLYEQFSEALLRDSLSLENISPDNAKVFKFVVEDIKLRLNDPQSYDDARAYALELA